MLILFKGRVKRDKALCIQVKMVLEPRENINELYSFTEYSVIHKTGYFRQEVTGNSGSCFYEFMFMNA